MNRLSSDRATSIIISFIVFVLIIRNSLYLEMFPYMHILFSGLRFLSWGLFLILILRSPHKLDSIAFWFILYGGIIGYSTLIHKSVSIFPVVSSAFDVFMLWGLCKLYLPDYGELLLKTIIKSMCFCIYANLIFLIIYPEGIYANDRSNFILGGNYNQMGGTIIPAIGIYGYYTLLYNRKKISFYILSLVSFLTLFLVGSKTSIVGLSLLLLFYFIKSNRIRIMLFIGFVLVYFVFQTIVVFVQMDLSQYEYIRYFVEDVLHKDLTFTERVTVWLNSISLIQDSPIIGYGYCSPDWFEERLMVKTTHNVILHILICGGWCALVAFVMQIVTTMKKYRKNANPATQFLFFGFWTFMFMMIMEVYTYVCIAILLILLYYSNHFGSKKNLERV